MRSRRKTSGNILLWAKAEASLSATCMCADRLREIVRQAGTLGWVAYKPLNKWCNSASHGFLSGRSATVSEQHTENIGTAHLYQGCQRLLRFVDEIRKTDVLLVARQEMVHGAWEWFWFARPIIRHDGFAGHEPVITQNEIRGEVIGNREGDEGVVAAIAGGDVQVGSDELGTQ